MNKKFYIVCQTGAIIGFLLCLISLYMRDFKAGWFNYVLYFCILLNTFTVVNNYKRYKELLLSDNKESNNLNN